MRIFIGIPLPHDVKFYLRETQTNILLYKAKANQTELDNFHVTLLFLGEVEQSKIEDLYDALTEQLKYMHAFSFNLGDIGAFVKGLDQIIWIGIRNQLDLLKKLQQHVKQVVKSLGLPYDDKPFKPHITLARHVRFETQSFTHQIGLYQKDIPVTHIHIYDSSRVHEKLIYTPLYTIRFKEEVK